MPFTDRYERANEHYLINRVRVLRGQIRKVRWLGRRGAPDRFVWIPGWKFPRMVELKAPGKTVRPGSQQEREIARLRCMHIEVWVCNTLEQIDEFLAVR